MIAELTKFDPNAVRRVLFDRLQNDPETYIGQMLGIELWEGQREVVRSVRDNRMTLVQSAHGVGKTHVSASLTQWYYDCFEPSITLTTAPSWNSVVELLWAEINVQRRTSGRLGLDEFCANFGGIATSLKRSELHYAKGHNSRTGEGFQGRHEEHLLIILDEGPGVPDYIWTAANSMLQSPMTRLLVIGNPTVTSGAYYDARTDPRFNVIRLSALDHPNIVAELEGKKPPLPKAVRLVWVEDMISKNCVKVSTPDVDCFEFPKGSGIWYMPNDEFRSRALGLFPKHAANAVWSEGAIEWSREHQLEIPKDIEPEIGCDVARFGDDLSTIYTRVGPCVLGGERHSQRDTIAVARLCIEKAQELGRQFGMEPKRVRIKVDDSGVGGGTVDYLRDQEFNVDGINPANIAIEEERYPNKRSELWFVTAERAYDKKLDFTRLDMDSFNKLKKDLLAPTYKLDGRARRVVESKDQTKSRLKRSPDDADGFNLAFAPFTDRSVPLVVPLVIGQQSTWSVGNAN